MTFYAELTCRTHYSFLRAASHPAELVVRAQELGLSALAITDGDGVYAVAKAHRAVESSSSSSAHLLKLIVGSELSLEGGGLFRLLCIDRAGYGLLCRVIAMSHKGRKKGRPTLSWNQFVEFMEDPGSQGLVIIVEGGENYDYLTLKEIFSDRVFLALCRLLDGKNPERTQKVLRLSRSFQIPVVAINGSHSALKSPDEMKALFSDLPEAIENTQIVADRCHFSLGELKYKYPVKWIPSGETAQSYLEKLTWKGAKERYPQGISPDVSSRIETELKLIRDVKSADYFLGFWEIVDFAKSRNILSQGRGAGVHSAVAFCLGITALDSTRINLVLPGSVDPLRRSPPEIDIDFEHEGRDAVIQHLIEEYGSENIARVAAGASTEMRTGHGIEDETQFSRRLSTHSGRYVVSDLPIIESVPLEPTSNEGNQVIQWDKEDLEYVGMLKVDVQAIGILTVLKKAIHLVQQEHPQIRLSSLPMDDRKTYEMIRSAQTIGVFLLETRAQMGRLLELQLRNFEDLVREMALIRSGPIHGQVMSSPVTFAFLAYASAYLKCHFPAQLSCALLNSQPTGFYSPSTLLEEVKRQGVSVSSLHINYSEWDFILEEKSLRLGWRMLPGVEKKDVTKLIEERSKGKFLSMANFLARVSLPPHVLYRFALAQAFSSFDLSPAQALWEIFSKVVSTWSALEGGNQLSLFRNSEPLSKLHPLLNVRQHLLAHRKIPVHSSDILRRTPHNRIVSLAGLIMVVQRFGASKGTIAATLEDEFGFTDLILHEKTYEKYEGLFASDPFVIITGRVERTGNSINFVVGHVETLFIASVERCTI